MYENAIKIVWGVKNCAPFTKNMAPFREKFLCSFLWILGASWDCLGPSSGRQGRLGAVFRQHVRKVDVFEKAALLGLSGGGSGGPPDAPGAPPGSAPFFSTTPKSMKDRHSPGGSENA